MTDSRIIRLPIEVPGGLTPEKMLAFKLKIARNVRGKTQTELGEAVGSYFNSVPVATDTISRWENGKSTIPGFCLGAISSVLNIDFEFFKV